MAETSAAEWEAGKAAHKALSDAAAERYDEIYESANFATGSYMRFEAETIVRLVPQAPSIDIAVDLGCGTGRDSFLLARYFKQVYGYDFSPEMIRVANRAKLTRGVGNVLFETLDVESERLHLDENSVGFVNSGFGMGSFLYSLNDVFREVRRVLQPKGIAVFSFYNSEALVNGLELEWKPALAARPVEGQDRLLVEFGDQTYEISAQAYRAGDIESRLKGSFRVLQVLTFPTLTALFPQTLFADERARSLCTRVDQLLAGNLDLAAGPYIVAVCQKGGHPQHTHVTVGYARVLELLQTHGIDPEIRSHAPVRNMADVRAVLDAPPSEMAKSVLVAADDADSSAPGYLGAALFLVVVPADRKLDMGSLARLLGRQRDRLRLANQVEVEELTGFQVGSIPPFGLPRNVPVVVDSRLAGLQRIWCGTGKATESLRIGVDDLRRLATFTEADVSKPDLPLA